MHQQWFIWYCIQCSADIKPAIVGNFADKSYGTIFPTNWNRTWFTYRERWLLIKNHKVCSSVEVTTGGLYNGWPWILQNQKPPQSFCRFNSCNFVSFWKFTSFVSYGVKKTIYIGVKNGLPIFFHFGILFVYHHERIHTSAIWWHRFHCHLGVHFKHFHLHAWLCFSFFRGP